MPCEDTDTQGRTLDDDRSRLWWLQTETLQNWATVVLLIYLFYFLRQGLTLLSRLECSGAITAHCSLDFLGLGDFPTSASWITGTTGMHHHAWLVCVCVCVFCRDGVLPQACTTMRAHVCVYFVELGFCHFAQAGLEFLGSSDLPVLASQSAGITGMGHGV